MGSAGKIRSEPAFAVKPKLCRSSRRFCVTWASAPPPPGALIGHERFGPADLPDTSAPQHSSEPKVPAISKRPGVPSGRAHALTEMTRRVIHPNPGEAAICRFRFLRPGHKPDATGRKWRKDRNAGGYELHANLFCEPRFHRALMQAGTAAVLVNDLHSVAREAADELPDSNVVLLIAAEDNCSIREATERTVHLHNEFVRGVRGRPAATRGRRAGGAPAIPAGCAGMDGGGFEWHSASNRCK
jgi:Terpene synthase family 2, C-terminal metal binding